MAGPGCGGFAKYFAAPIQLRSNAKDQSSDIMIRCMKAVSLKGESKYEGNLMLPTDAVIIVNRTRAKL